MVYWVGKVFSQLVSESGQPDIVTGLLGGSHFTNMGKAVKESRADYDKNAPAQALGCASILFLGLLSATVFWWLV